MNKLDQDPFADEELQQEQASDQLIDEFIAELRREIAQEKRKETQNHKELEVQKKRRRQFNIPQIWLR